MVRLMKIMQKGFSRAGAMVRLLKIMQKDFSRAGSRRDSYDIWCDGKINENHAEGFFARRIELQRLFATLAYSDVYRCTSLTNA